jgi:TolB-like protein
MDYQVPVQPGIKPLSPPPDANPIHALGGNIMISTRGKALLAVLLIIAFSASPALGSQPRTYAVLPFEVHGPEMYRHLSQGIQSMLVSRLNRQGRFIPVDKTAVAAVGTLAHDSAREPGEILSSLGAEYLIWGSVTILGTEASLDIQVMEQGQDPWSESTVTPVDNLIPALESSAASIGARIFPEPSPAAAAAPTPGKTAKEVAPGQQPPLNPEFRHHMAADTTGQFRSQSLPFSSVGMVAGDADGDGQNEIFILEERRVRAYSFEQGRLRELDTFQLPHTYVFLNINMLDLDRDGYQEIIVTAMHGDTPRSFILNLRNKKFTTVSQRIDLYLNVIRTPPDFMPTLIGQRQHQGRLLQSPVHEVDRIGGEFRLGRRLLLPTEANAFNFAYLPVKEGYKILLADKKDKLRVYSDRNALQHTTFDQFAGSGIGLETDDTMPGLQRSTASEGSETFYYIPLRIIPVDLNRDGTFDIIVNRNISLAGRFFGRYRAFPQGEINSLTWDGIGLSPVWKTRLIQGTVADYGFADINNDGLLDLYVLVNTHPGFTGLANVRTIILGYTLDLESLSPSPAAGFDELQ